jgi:hypothetical protein
MSVRLVTPWREVIARGHSAKLEITVETPITLIEGCLSAMRHLCLCDYVVYCRGTGRVSSTCSPALGPLSALGQTVERQLERRADDNH